MPPVPTRPRTSRLRSLRTASLVVLAGTATFALIAIVQTAAAGDDDPSETTKLPATTVATSREAVDLSAEFRVPEGFRVERFAGDELAHDLFAMTFDPRGRVVVAGPGYIRTLHDDDGDGRADRGLDYATTKGGAHGMAFDGPNLYATADNALLYFVDADEDGVADGEPERILELKSPEHGTNGLAWGPDGWLYGITGNDAGVTPALNTVENPLIPKPNCGVVWRYDPKSKKSEIVAHGFRNAYDLDFLPTGEIMTVDSDGERDQYLPWYAPTRLFDVQLGGHHGWIQEGWQKSWNRPAYYFDVVDRVCEIGRGSPTGVETYDGELFPARYRGNPFSACWTLGRIYFFDLRRTGSTFTSEPEVFLETKGTVGFAPVDLGVGPKGALYVAVGGRGTQGSVFRVTYEGESEPAADEGRDADPSAVTDLPPEVELRRTLERALDEGTPVPDATAFAIANSEDERIEQLFRRVCVAAGLYATDWTAADAESALEYLSTSPPEEQVDSLRLAQIALGDWSVEPQGPAVYAGYELNREAPTSFAAKLAAAPLQKGATPEALAEWLRLAGAVNLSYEQAQPVIDLWFAREDLSPQEEIHALICISRMPGERPEGATERIAAVLAKLPHRMRELGQQPSRNFPDRVREVVLGLLTHDPALAGRLVAHPAFGAPAHAEWVGLLPDDLRAEATRKIVTSTDPEEWTSETIDLFVHLGDDLRQASIDDAWDQPALREATIRRIAERPREADVDRLLVGLDSPNASTVELAANAIRSLNVEGTPLQQAKVVRALRQQLSDKQAINARRALVALLGRWTGSSYDVEESDDAKLPAIYAPVIESWEQAHPEMIAAASSQADDLAAWLDRLPVIESEAGDAERGRKVFEARSCSRCHAGTSRVGPDLKGAAQRLSPRDLLVTIVDPNREVSPTYQTSRLLTRSGKAYVGMVVYESPEGTLLQTDAETTIRIAGEEVASLDKVRQSLMPTGLLREADADEVADLFAYLRTLK